MAKRRKTTELAVPQAHYDGLVGKIAELLEQSRRTAARTVNSILTATYWEIGRRIVEFEQGGKARAEYGTELLKRLGKDLTARFGRGFAWRNLFRMRNFYFGWEILPTPSAILEARVRLPEDLPESVGEATRPESGALAIRQTPSAEFDQRLFAAFPLAWSHYVRLMAVEKPHARAFYEAEAIRGGWSVRQLDRQIYLNYAQQHLTEPRENDPVGIILCSGKDDAVVEYATGGINARVFASKYLTQLPDADTLRKEIETTRRALLDHRQLHPRADSQ